MVGGHQKDGRDANGLIVIISSYIHLFAATFPDRVTFHSYPMPRRSVEDHDPLTLAIAPPPNENPADKEKRLTQERKAKEISDKIDEEINAQRLAEKKEVPIKVLLLGVYFPASFQAIALNF